MSYKYYGQFNPPVDKIIFERYFPNKTHGTCIEAGAYDGITESSTYFFEKNFNWTCFNIEPLPIVYDNLIKNRPHAKNFNIALSNKNGEATFINYKHPTLNYNWGNGSLSHSDKHKKMLEQLCSEKQVMNVKCITYSTFIKQNNIQELDLFVLDVEGHELQVIEGMYECDILPNVFVIEHGYNPIGYFDSYLSNLKCKYKLDYTSFVNSFYIKC